MPEGVEQRYLQDDKKQINNSSDPRATGAKMKTTKDLLVHGQIADIYGKVPYLRMCERTTGTREHTNFCS